MKENQWHPGTILETSGYYWKTCALHAGVKLDVFTPLAAGPKTAAEMAREKELDPDALDRLLNAMAAMGLLEKTGDQYANTDAADRFLVRTSDAYVGYMVLHHHHLVESWSRLDESARTGAPVRTRASFTDPDRREAFLMGMFNNAMQMAPKVAEAVDLSGRRRLLDLGGGPGTYAIFFCRHYPELTAAVYDLPTTRPFAEKTIQRFGMTGRVDFREGDYIESGDFGGPYDAVWMSHILHGEGPADCRRMVDRAAAVLAPGGELFIHEFILDDSRDGPLFPALFSLNMLLGTEEGRAYTGAELHDMMTAAGLSDIRRLDFRGPTDSGIMGGRKP